MAFSSDGAKMFVVGYDGDEINEYALSTAFDASTATHVDDILRLRGKANPSGMAFSNDGTKMFVVGFAGDDVNEYALSTAFDASTATFVDALRLITGSFSNRHGILKRRHQDVRSRFMTETT